MGIAVLLRHGRSTANHAGVLSGQLPGVGLASDGQEQVRVLGDAFRGLEFTSLHISPLQRTRETAAAAFGDHPFVMADALLDCNYGSWSGLKHEDLASEPLWKTLHATPSTVRFPDGESITEISTRAIDYVRAHAAPDGVHVFVTHADVILFVANHAADAPLDSYQRLSVEPASLTLVRVSEDRMSLLGLNIPPSGAAATVRPLLERQRDSV